MASYGESVDRLLNELAKLPGVGRKTAERLAHHILRTPTDEAMKLAVAIRDVKRNTRSCSRCANVTESDPCAICSDGKRDQHAICVVEHPRDVVAIEEAAAWHGVYHVLGGRVSPLDGVSSEDLTIGRLVKRVKDEATREVVLATSPDLEGDGTALYVERALAGTGVKTSRIARGIPTGYALENSSSAMLHDAFKGRVHSGDGPPASDESGGQRRQAT